MRIKFNQIWNFTPQADRRQTTKYRPDDEATVKREDGELVVKAGAAEEIEAQRPEEPAKSVSLAGKADKGKAD